VPTKPDDARAQRSIEALHAAFLELIEFKPLDQILLREITDTAGLSYPTFFRRFSSKEDLLVDIARNEVRALMGLSGATIEPRQFDGGRGMFERVQGRRQLWTTLLTGGATAAMREEFIRASRELVDAHGRVRPDIPLDLASGFFAGAVFEIFAWWLRQPEDYPIDDAIKLFEALVVRPLGRPRE
jgi:AcrR family transcriptional regulator